MKVSTWWLLNISGEGKGVSISDDGRYALVLTSAASYYLDLDARTHRTLSGEGASRGMISPDGEYACIARGRVLGLYERNGTQVGRLEFRNGISSCLLCGGRVIVGTSAGEIYAFREDGGFLWEAEVDGPCGMMRGDGGTSLFVYHGPKRVSMLDIGTGRVRWSAGTITSAVGISLVASGESFVSTVDGRIIQFNPVGTVIWNPRIGAKIVASDVSADGRYISVADGSSLHIYSGHKTLLRRWECGEVKLVRLTDSSGCALVALSSGVIAFAGKEENIWTYMSMDPVLDGDISRSGNRIVILQPKRVMVFDNTAIFDGHVKDIIQKLIVAQGFGTNVEEANVLARQARERARMGDYSSALTMLHSTESASVRVREVARPVISLVAAVNENFTLDRWTKVLTYVMNTGSEHAADIQMVSLTDGLEVRWDVIPSLKVDECMYIEFMARAIRAWGPRAELELRMWNFAGKAFTSRTTAEIRVEKSVRRFTRPKVIFTMGDRAKVIAAARRRG